MLLRKYEYIGSHYFLNDERRQETTQHRVTSDQQRQTLDWVLGHNTGSSGPGPGPQVQKPLDPSPRPCLLSSLPAPLALCPATVKALVTHTSWLVLSRAHQDPFPS